MRNEIDHLAFLRAYEKELEFFHAQNSEQKIKTIFFGGGTPSLMPTFLLDGILQKIHQLWQVDENCEISLEANPTSFEAEKFSEFKACGINRISLGIQALNDEDLKFLGREHSAKEAMATIEKTAQIFDNFSFDLIYARPKQQLQQWLKELKQAIDFGTKHMSLYQLTIEKGTRFYSDFQQKKFTMPSDELAAEFYEETNLVMNEAGLSQYEISNYAKKGFESRHNLIYWQGGEYFGVGAGAHSRVNAQNFANCKILSQLSERINENSSRLGLMMVHEPQKWLEKVEKYGAGIQKIENISKNELVEEIVLMGLRLVSGINKKEFRKLTGEEFSEVFDAKKLEKLQQKNLIEIDENFVKIPQEKMVVANGIIEMVVS